MICWACLDDDGEEDAEEPQLKEASVDAVTCCSILKPSTYLLRSPTLMRRLQEEDAALHMFSNDMMCK